MQNLCQKGMLSLRSETDWMDTPLHFISFQIHQILNKHCSDHDPHGIHLLNIFYSLSFSFIWFSLINHTRKRSKSFDLSAKKSFYLYLSRCINRFNRVARAWNANVHTSQHRLIHNSMQFHTFSPNGTIYQRDHWLYTRSLTLFLLSSFSFLLAPSIFRSLVHSFLYWIFFLQS